MRCSDLSMGHTRALIAFAGAAGLAVPQAAQASTLAPLASCYRSVDELSRERVPVQAAGYTPGAEVRVYIDGVEVRRGIRALPDGTVSGSVSAPYQARGARGFTLTVTEPDTPANTASATSRVTALDLRLRPRVSDSSRRVSFIGRGFIDGPGVYGHYILRGKLRRTVDLGAPKGPCGRVNTKRTQIPAGIRRPGRWTLQVDNDPDYKLEPAGVSVRVPITVTHALGAR
jgi:hypothetical protein